MSDDEPRDPDHEPQHRAGPARGDADAIRRAIDELDAEPAPGSPGGPPPARARELSENVRRRVRERLGDVAYIQLEHRTGDHRVCRVGTRGEGRIRDEIVVVGPAGVARREEVEERVDELRRGADPADVAGLTAGG